MNSLDFTFFLDEMYAPVSMAGSQRFSSKFDNSFLILVNNMVLNGLPPTDSSIEFHLSWAQA